jgi:hypothetical protein
LESIRKRGGHEKKAWRHTGYDHDRNQAGYPNGPFRCVSKIECIADVDPCLIVRACNAALLSLIVVAESIEGNDRENPGCDLEKQADIEESKVCPDKPILLENSTKQSFVKNPVSNVW